MSAATTSEQPSSGPGCSGVHERGVGECGARIRHLSHYVPFLCAALLCISSFVSFTVAIVQFAPERRDALSLEPQRVDFGRVEQGSTQIAHVRLANSSDNDSVEIVTVIPNCGCTASEVSDRSIAPRESTELTLEWEIGSRRNATSVECVVEYRLGTSQEIHREWIVLKADVAPTFVVTGDALSFAPNKRADAEVTVRPRDPALHRLVSASCTDRSFSAEIKQLSFNGCIVTVTFDPTYWRTEHSREATLVLTTNSELEPKLELPLFVR